MLWLRRTYETSRDIDEVYGLMCKYTEPNKYRVQMYSEAMFIGTVSNARFKAIPNKLFAKSRHGASVTVSGRLKKTDMGTKIVAWARPSLIYQLLFFVLYLASLSALLIGGAKGIITLLCLVTGITAVLFALFFIPVRNGLKDVQTVLNKRR